MKLLINITAAIFLLSLSIVSAQQADFSNEPGYIDFGDVSAFENEDEFVEVILNERLLRMVSKISKSEDEELANLISGLKLIKVNVLTVNKVNKKLVDEKIKSVEKQLKSKNWERIVTAKSRGDKALVYIKADKDDDVVGLAVTAFEENGDVAFVNIVGKINLETIGRLSEKFDIPSLDDIDHAKREKKK
ncbi:MAG: DUF4252 domain-containing protein [Bacteroidetes bacterium]|nr:DUF4252 domain-containing protein [Bacteroidota bacterium]